MPSWLCLETDVYFSNVLHNLVILMTVCNDNLPLSVEGKTSQVPEIYIIMQQPNTRCYKSYQSWQSQNSNTYNIQPEERTCLRGEYHELVSSWNAIKITCSPFTVKLQLSTAHTEPKRERSVTGKIQSGLWLGNTCSSSHIDSEMQLLHPLLSHPLHPLIIYFLKKYLL